MKHIALTIGPIVDTLSLGRKTSEVWMASYLFSSFMKNTIKALKERSDAKFIIPFVDDEILKEQDDGVGMFHDRFILTTETLTIDEVESILLEQKDAIAVMVAQSIKEDEQKVKVFFRQYLQTYLFETTEEFENPILDISTIMDSIELHTPRLEAEDDYIRRFLNRDIILNSSLAKTSFGKKPSFEAIDAIAAQELDDDMTAQNAHRYIAIIYADGDNLGKYIKNQSDVTQVSKKLFDFDKKATQTIKDFGGLPIFIGGDDLIIFAPLLNDGKTVFDLLNSLSSDYQEALGTDESTLSFGVSLTYYKYPLYEALARARDALFDVAKNYEGKNAIALSTQKHSGQSFEFCIGKDESVYSTFLTLIGKVLNEEIELPHAIHHKLQSHQKLFEAIPMERLESTFENIFNEDLHKSKFKEGLESIQELINELGLEQSQQKKLFSMLSTIKVLRGDR
jgi:CRISPR-associated protein Cmr2